MYAVYNSSEYLLTSKSVQTGKSKTHQHFQNKNVNILDGYKAAIHEML